VGSIGNPSVRIRLFNTLCEMPNIVDASAKVSKHSQIVVVNAGAVIGQGAIINSGAIVEHDCEIGEFVHIAPGTVLCGGVKIGRHSHFNRNGKRCNKKHKGQCNSLWESVQRGEEPLKVFVIAEAGINHNKKTGGCRQRCRC